MHVGADERRYTIAFANLTEEPGVTLEGTGFTGREVRESFVLAARRLPVELVLYDNRRDPKIARDNAADAARRKVDLFVEYFDEPTANQAIARTLHEARIPVLAISHPVGDAPLYTADNVAAGRLAGEALADFAARSWSGRAVVALIVGPVGARHDRLPERVQGITEGLRRRQPALRIATLDTQGNPATVGGLVGKAVAAQPGAKFLVAALDDATALAAKSALESAGRLADGAIVGQGCDRTVHGGASDRKEIDPNNRGSIVLGSVAFFLDRYGYEVLPLALRVLRGERVPARTPTSHLLITAANVFREYPPYDMQ
ncbi:MAG TPA: substrate-binding domain-containing protein [Methylomirabilota bacterium]|nr:substrate-binding domain-containing protein [Methylomirabilota bacterium]